MTLRKVVSYTIIQIVALYLVLALVVLGCANEPLTEDQRYVQVSARAEEVDRIKIFKDECEQRNWKLGYDGPHSNRERVMTTKMKNAFIHHHARMINYSCLSPAVYDRWVMENML
ncbi:hypothetical protein LCGC14_2167890 [marine sediment metagenome]|uniref:Uncharacterized protein n=1 Tax=marine sediment metagenome TaxID=412755 RepID=A0A0F9DQR2_9ZZZZ